MASLELTSFAQQVEDSITQNGITYKAVDTLAQIARIAIEEEKDIEYGLKVSGKAKEFIERLVEEQTGVSIFKADEYCLENRTTIDEVSLWWSIQKMEAPYKFESYLYYMEKKRKYPKKFYYPRRNTLKIVVDDLQALDDGELDFYGLSMPPRVGKVRFVFSF